MRYAATGIYALFCAGLAAGTASGQSLDAALEMAEAANPSLEAGRTGSEIAREALTTARAQGGTTVRVVGSGGFESVDSNRPFNTNVGERPTLSAQVEASRPLYTGGRIRAGVRAAEAGIDAADYDLESLRQSIYFSTISAFLNVRTGYETVAIRENNVALLTEQVEAAMARFDVGFITRTDVALAQARLAAAVAGQASAEAQLQGFAADFEAVTGAYPADLGVMPPAPILPASFEEALVLAQDNNPALAAARENVRAANDAIDVARAGGRLQLDIVGSAGAQRDLDNQFDDSEVSVYARGSVPLFQGGLVNSQVRTATLRREQARLQVQVAERDIRAGLATAWYGQIAALRALEASQRQVEAAEIAFEGAQRELAVGTRTTLEVLDSEQDLLNARLSRVNAQRDAQLAAYRIIQLTGGLTRDAILTPAVQP